MSIMTLMAGQSTEDWVHSVGNGRVSELPDVWTDGSLVRDELTDICSGGAGVFSFSSGSGWFRRSWGHLELLPPDEDSGSERSWIFFSVPNPLQTVQRAELWGVIAALQADRPVHLGVDNANVVGHVGRMLAQKAHGKPYELLVDGDLLALIHMLISVRGPRTTKISKVKGHADEELVRRGKVREVDKKGNDMADRAADFGRRRVGAGILDARRNLSNACGTWYPVIRELHRFFIAISRAVVNEDGCGGRAPDPLVWSAGGKVKRKRPVEAIRDYAMLPGPQRLWTGSWVHWPVIEISDRDLVNWPFSPGSLVKLAAFLSSLSWPGEVDDMGPGGISYIEMLILYERWAGERLRVEDSLPKHKRRGRKVVVTAAPIVPDVQIWKLCRYLGAMLRALANLPGGLGWFLPGRIGANHGRLRHVGWEKCCHGLTCRPLESSGEGFLSDFLSLLGYPSGSGKTLLEGSLRLKYQSLPFANRKPTWRLPVEGMVPLVIAEYERSLVPLEAPCTHGVGGGGFLQKGVKRVRLTKKTPRHLVSKISPRSIPEDERWGPVLDVSPGHGRVVARRVHGVSSPGSRLDEEGIG